MKRQEALAIVGGFGGALVLAPDRTRRREAVRGAFAAEAPARLEERIASIHDEEGDAGEVAVEAADEGVVAGLAGRSADVDLADLLGVVGDGGKVEGAIELDPAKRSSRRVEGLDSEWLAGRRSDRRRGA